MALPNYDVTKHHIGLAQHGQTLKGYMIGGSYIKQPQRATAPSEFGGDRDLVQPGLMSRWTQDDFGGGAYQDTWGTDPAMFAFSTNFIPSLIEKSARSVPPLRYWSGPGKVDASTALAIFASGARVAVVETTQTRHYNINTGALSSTSSHATNEVKAAAHDPSDNYIYAITKHTGTGALLLRRYKDGVAIATIGSFAAGYNGYDPIGIEMMGKDVIACLRNNSGGYVLLFVDIADDRSSIEVTRIGRLPGPWRSSVVYNGLVYILITDLEQRTAVMAWDGSQLLPVVDFPYNFRGQKITVYGGRVFVCGHGADIAGVERYGELYEITGSTLRTVRTFAWEARAGLPCPTSMNAMVVHEGLLWLGTNKEYLIAYDLTRDALWSKFDIVPDTTNLGGPYQVKHLLSTNEKLLAWVNDGGGSGGTSGDGFYRMASTDADLNSTSYYATIETSDFAPEPDRDKRWSQLRVLSRYGEPELDYSKDGGFTWTAVTGVSSGGAPGNLYYNNFDLSAIPVSTAIRFRLKYFKNVVKGSELLAFTCSFLFLDTGKCGWQFALADTDQIELVDGTTLDQDNDGIHDTLWGFWTNRTTLDFTDLDGSTHNVIITDLTESQPVIGPRLSDTSREAMYSIVLTEI